MASAGCPGSFPVAVDAYEVENPEYVGAVVLDSARQRWIVRCPRTQEASVRLESEHVILHSFTPGCGLACPSSCPPSSARRTGTGCGRSCTRRSRVRWWTSRSWCAAPTWSSPEREPLSTQLGKALATIHTLPIEIVREGDLPTYTAQRCRDRMLAELDRAAGTGKVPAPLLRRWESRLEDPRLWRFRPTVIHGDLSEENLVLDGTRLAAVRGWHDMQVADPAADFAWLMSCPDQDFADAIVEVYTVQLPHTPDPHLLRRAYLHAEFALAQWLVRGTEQGDEATVSEAQAMLRTLERGPARIRALDEPRDADAPAD
ncbi:hypothetical protein A5N15_05265 [Rothia kristinae]|uniref:Aminoglycoside phosphotransferase domain-containing protein n=1 Tax=Rothia kristinae TaxID=37923 RepID=A0A657IUX3_9MICC|nr:hypothetical protein A5N15_05265 [Rothia kristinae]